MIKPRKETKIITITMKKIMMAVFAAVLALNVVAEDKEKKPLKLLD